MDEGMGEARMRAVDALEKFPPVRDWAFEFTPASSENPQATYLQKVRDSDFVIWIVRDRTSPAVDLEIRTALEEQRPLLAFRLKAEKRDGLTTELLRFVGEIAKWQDVGDVTDLGGAIAASLSDEFVRAVRGRPSGSRSKMLEQMARASEARCVQRWQASGIRRDIAIAWAQDPLIGAPASPFLPTPERPLSILLAGAGGGKSLAAERMLQRAVSAAISDTRSPLPIYIPASQTRTDLRQLVSERYGAVGHPSTLGAFIVVDGLDELGATDAFPVVDQCRLLVTESPSSRAVLTARPLPGLSSLEESGTLPLLTDEEVLTLAEQSAEQPHGRTLWNLPEPVRQVVHLPLFAILLGLYWSERSFHSPSSSGQLIDFLARQVAPTNSVEARSLATVLRRAAKLAIERDGVVPVAEVGGEEDVEPLLRSPVVAIDRGWLSFNLPVLLHWFAAQSLALSDPPIEILVETPSRLNAWRHALVVLVSTQGTTKVNEILKILAEAEPGVASTVVKEALADRGSQEEGSLPTPEVCGGLIRTAMSSWLDGLGPLVDYVGPTDGDGNLLSLGVGGDQERLVATWHTVDADPDVVRLSTLSPEDLFSRGWGGVHSFSPSRQSGWSWRWTLDYLQKEVENVLSYRFLCESSDLAEGELFEQAALLTPGRRLLTGGPVLVNELSGVIDAIGDADVVQAGGRQFDPSLLIRRIGELQNRSVVSLLPPWPEPDRAKLSSGHMSSLYSDDCLKRRVEAAYLAALRGYVELAESLFPRMKHRLATFATLPAVLEGELSRTEVHGTSDVPVFSWRLRPLAHGESRVDIRWATERDIRDRDPIESADPEAEVLAEFRRLRADASTWLFPSFHQEILDVYSYSAMNIIAYRWLWRDLERVAWVTSSIKAELDHAVEGEESEVGTLQAGEC